MKNIRKYYDHKAPSYKIKGQRLANIIELIAPVKGKKILDIGCADGALGVVLQRMGAQVVGIDISKKAVSIAKKKLLDAKVIDIDEQKLPFNKKDFDFVIASEVIEHLFDPSKLLAEAYKVLKLNGSFVVSTPNLLYWANRFSMLGGKFEYTNEGVFDRGHIHFYTYSTLIKDLTEAGFKINKTNNVYPGTRLLKPIKDLRPSIFAYQILIRAEK